MLALPVFGGAQTGGTSPAQTPRAVATPATAPALYIAAGDLLDVAVFDTPELSAKLRVDSKGDIVLPVGGVIHVAGQTAEQAAVTVEAQLREGEFVKFPHVTVFISEYSTQGVSVLGEVRNPGVYPVLGTLGLLDLVSVAGGLTPSAGKAVAITHKTDTEHPVIVLLDNSADLAARANIQILPGDTVVVSRSGVVYVVGDVGRPGGFLVENNDRLTVLQALALARGTNKTAALGSVRLIRKTQENRTETALKLKKILAGKAPDIRLQDGDILFVPSSAVKTWAYRGSEAAVQMTVGLVTYGRL